MTTEQPKAAGDDHAPASAERHLRRRLDDRVIGGVASGLGDFLNVDPLLIRIGFVGLMVFGGLGLLLYVGAWALVPDETTDESIAEQLLERAGLTTSRFLVGMLLLVGALLFLGGMGNAFAYQGFAVASGVAIVVIVLGAVLLRQGEGPTAVSTVPRRKGPAAAARPARPPIAAAPERAARRRRPRSPLGWYVLGGMLVAVGLLALATNVSNAAVDLGQFFGLALAVLGTGLVVGAWWGSARLLILLGILLLPVGVLASFVTAPIEGGLGYHFYRPSSPGELRGEYRLAGGQLVLDLRDVEADGQPIEITASVAVGELFVLVPQDGGVELDAAVGAGGLRLFGLWQAGTGLDNRQVIEGDGGPRFLLDLETGLGGVLVVQRPPEGR